MNALLVAVIVVLGASASTCTRDLQVEAVAASGAELPELREAVARALLVGGARVVMRGPTTGACEYCAHIKVTELAPGIFRIESEDQGEVSATTLDLSSGSRHRHPCPPVGRESTVGSKSARLLSDNYIFPTPGECS